MVTALQIEVTVGGQPADLSQIHSPVKVTWGRDDPRSQASAPTFQYTTEGPPPAIGTPVHVAFMGLDRFTGHVTAVTSNGAAHAVTCHGASAQLGRKYVGAPPWPRQTILARCQEIARLAPNTSSRYGIGSDTWWDEEVRASDVDRRTVLELFMSLAESAGMLAWERKDGLLVCEPMNYRATVLAATTPATILADWVHAPVAWGDDIAQVINRASVSYGADANASTEVVVEDAASIAAHGEASVSVGSSLASVTAATRLATLIVNRWAASQWLVGQVTIDSDRVTNDQWWRNRVLPAQVSTAVSLPVASQPGAAGPVDRGLWFLEGADEEIHATRHLVTWKVSPAERYGLSVLTWADWKTRTWAQMKTRTWAQVMEGALP